MIDYDSMNPVQRAVFSALNNGGIWATKELIPLCMGAIPRDVIKGLRRLGFLIHRHGKKGWRLDERHMSGDSKAIMVATAEAKVRHSINSLKLAKREAERIPNAIEKNKQRFLELAELKNSPDIKSI